MHWWRSSLKIGFEILQSHAIEIEEPGTFKLLTLKTQSLKGLRVAPKGEDSLSGKPGDSRLDPPETNSCIHLGLSSRD